jgi:DNA invertase Pin-like site-specific DNA recombinase
VAGGWKVIKVYENAGISGAKGRNQRPGLDALMKAVNAKEFDMVASWSVDRLGRSLTELLGILQGLHEKESACSFTNKDIVRRPPARRCFRCWAYLLNSSGGLFERGSTLG